MSSEEKYQEVISKLRNPANKEKIIKANTEAEKFKRLGIDFHLKRLEAYIKTKNVLINSDTKNLELDFYVSVRYFDELFKKDNWE